MALAVARYGVTHPRQMYQGAMTFARTANAVKRKASQAMAMYAAAAHYAKRSRPARARAGTYARKVRKAFGSRKRRQGQVRKAFRPGPGVSKPPTTPSARVSAKYAVASSMTKFKKAKATAVKVPKSAIVHYKEYGQYNTEKCMYINHEHWGSADKMWAGVGLGLAKLLLPKAKIYNGKLMTDPCIGPRTNTADPLEQYDDKGTNYDLKLRLVYINEGASGSSRIVSEIDLEDLTASPDKYKTFDRIARDIEASLRSNYNQTGKRWLAEAQFFRAGFQNPADQIYVQNLDDAEIHLYVNSLLKFQNVTPADHGAPNSAAGNLNPYDKGAIDANPLIGRVYTARGHQPQIDSDLLQAGNKTLDVFFNVGSDSTGMTLLGRADSGNPTIEAQRNADVGRISSIPNARELYGNQTVKTGIIRMGAGAMKFHKTSFTFKKTFRQLADFHYNLGSAGAGTGNYTERAISPHTLFGLTTEHRHGEDTLQLGFNRDLDVGCYIKHKRVVHPIKTNFVLDEGVIVKAYNPTDHPEL